MMKRIWRLLRSRQAAVWALLAFVVYAAVATTVSDGDWAVPYRNPVFLMLAAFLTLSTGACAWERTRAAARSARLVPATPPALDRLRTDPGMVLEAPPGADPVQSAEKALRRLGMRTVRTGDSVEARAGMAGAFGSPVFHWALALLFVIIALGQLTRSEGLIGVVSGSSRVDVAESYGRLETGSLVESLTGRIIAVPSIESSYTANGVQQGVTPYVEIRSPDGATVLAEGYAYPNHPIRYRWMLVHLSTDGLAAIVRVSGQGESFTSEVLIDYNEDRSAVEPGVLGIADGSGATVATVMIEPAEGSSPGEPLARIRAASGDASPDVAPAVDAVVHEGEPVAISGDLTLEVLKLTKYARLSVVNDWSVYPIYGLCVLAVVGLTMAVFWPLRGVRVLHVVESGGECLYVRVRHGRGDPHFPGRVEAALRGESGEGEAGR